MFQISSKFKLNKILCELSNFVWLICEHRVVSQKLARIFRPGNFNLNLRQTDLQKASTTRPRTNFSEVKSNT